MRFTDFHSVQIAYGRTIVIQISDSATCPLCCPTVYNLDSSCSPVFEEASQPKGHQLQNGLQNKDGGEHVVAVLEGSLQGLWKEEKGNINSIKLPGCSVIGYNLGGTKLPKTTLQLRVCTMHIIIEVNLVRKGHQCLDLLPQTESRWNQFFCL